MKRLRNPRLHRFKSLPSPNGLLYFAQLLEEALFEYSLDSYKVPALNTHTRCRELLRTVDEVEAGHVREAALNSIVEELAESIADDPTVKRLVGAPARELQRASWWVQGDLDRLRVQGRFLLGKLWRRRYERALREDLLELVSDGTRKLDINRAAMSLLVEWMTLGYSHAFLFFTVKQFFWGFGGAKLTSTSLEHFFRTFDRTKKKYSVIIRTTKGWDVLGRMLDPNFAEYLENAPAPREGLTREKEFLGQSSEGFLVLKDVDALEPRAATEAAMSRVRALHSSLLLHRHRGEPDWHEGFLVYDDQHPIVLKAQRDPMHREEECEDGELPDRLAQPLLAIARVGPDSSTPTRLAAALGLHASAVRSDEHQVQLLSLWSALETLLPPGGEGARIVEIRQRLVPALSASYPLKLLNHLFNSLQHCSPDELDKALLALPTSAKGLEGVAQVVCLEGNRAIRTELLESLNFNPLLRYRLWHLSKLFAKPMEIRQVIKQHEQRVEWHVERIYRTRNLLAHSGRHLPYLPTLVENLHRYFHRLIGEIVSELASEEPAADIDSAVLGVQLRMEAHLNYLAEFKAEPFPSEAVLKDCLAGPGRGWNFDPLVN